MMPDPNPIDHPRGLRDLRIQALVRNCISASQVRRIACQNKLDMKEAIKFWNQEKQKP